MSRPALSVIICTHNPRADYLARTLAGLRTQSLAADQWELVVIDNASREPLGSCFDFSWHPTARIVREDEVGLTPARLRGIAEARATPLALVDDDNILAPDYLERGVTLSQAWPNLGAWGCGRYTPEW